MQQHTTAPDNTTPKQDVAQHPTGQHAAGTPAQRSTVPHTTYSNEAQHRTKQHDTQGTAQRQKKQHSKQQRTTARNKTTNTTDHSTEELVEAGQHSTTQQHTTHNIDNTKDRGKTQQETVQGSPPQKAAPPHQTAHNTGGSTHKGGSEKQTEEANPSPKKKTHRAGAKNIKRKKGGQTRGSKKNKQEGAGQNPRGLKRTWETPPLGGRAAKGKAGKKKATSRRTKKRKKKAGVGERRLEQQHRKQGQRSSRAAAENRERNPPPPPEKRKAKQQGKEQAATQKGGQASLEGAKQTKKATQAANGKVRRIQTRPGGRPARPAQEKQAHAHAHRIRAWRPLTGERSCQRPHETAPVHQPSTPPQSRRYGKPEASVTGSTRTTTAAHAAKYRRQREPPGTTLRRVSEWVRRRARPGPQWALGRHQEPGSRPASTCAKPQTQKRGEPRTRSVARNPAGTALRRRYNQPVH